jgi:predicted subunit of tRNA(5-methylaminomethyl-2-thiouridylate) methyltransferase
MIDEDARPLDANGASLEILESMSRWYEVVHEYTRRNSRMNRINCQRLRVLQSNSTVKRDSCTLRGFGKKI